MTWIVLAGLTALFESFKDLASKRTLPFADIYIVSWALFAPMLLLLAGLWILRQIPPLGPQFIPALIVGGLLNAIAILLYVKALDSGDLSLTVPVVALTPLFLLVTSPWIVGESPSVADFLGVVMIVLGAYVLNLKEKQKGYLAPLRALFYQRGPRLMLTVAFIWSLTANIDKIGVFNSTPTFWVVALFSFIAIALLPIIVLKSHHPLQQVKSHCLALTAIGGLNGLTVILQMQAIQIALVTHVIAVKRLSVLLGVLWGWWFFKETDIRERITGAGLMVIGVFCLAMF